MRRALLSFSFPFRPLLGYRGSSTAISATFRGLFPVTCHRERTGMKFMKPVALFGELLKTKAATGGGRLLGLDVGDKYVGLAVSDPLNKIASPLSVLVRKESNIDLMAIDFQTLISELSLRGFVFGYPFDRSRDSPHAMQIKLLIDDLCQTGRLDGLKYTYWGENFTSKGVELLIKPLDLHPAHAKTIVDKYAAVDILQGYLDYVNRNPNKEFEYECLSI